MNMNKWSPYYITPKEEVISIKKNLLEVGCDIELAEKVEASCKRYAAPKVVGELLVKAFKEDHLDWNGIRTVRDRCPALFNIGIRYQTSFSWHDLTKCLKLEYPE